MRRLIAALALLLSTNVIADPLFMKDLVGEGDFFPPWGVGVDFFTMDQDYEIKELEFNLPGVILPEPSQVDVSNDVQHFDVRGDVWLTPFLNVHALLGHVQNDTSVDLSNAIIIGLPISLGSLDISSDGTVWGLGGTLVYGSPRWFAALTASYNKVDLSGDFDSDTEAFSIQPRIGLIRGGWTFWVGGMYLDIEESHSGTINLPGLGSVPFSTVLGAATDWNAAVGTRYFFSNRSSISLELGFGDRDHTLFNYNFRF